MRVDSSTGHGGLGLSIFSAGSPSFPLVFLLNKSFRTDSGSDILPKIFSAPVLLLAQSTNY